MTTLHGVPRRGRAWRVGQFGGAARQTPHWHMPSAYTQSTAHDPPSAASARAKVAGQPEGGAMGHVFVRPIWCHVGGSPAHGASLKHVRSESHDGDSALPYSQTKPMTAEHDAPSSGGSTGHTVSCAASAMPASAPASRGMVPPSVLGTAPVVPPHAGTRIVTMSATRRTRRS